MSVNKNGNMPKIIMHIVSKHKIVSCFVFISYIFLFLIFIVLKNTPWKIFSMYILENINTLNAIKENVFASNIPSVCIKKAPVKLKNSAIKPHNNGVPIDANNIGIEINISLGIFSPSPVILVIFFVPHFMYINPAIVNNPALINACENS